MISERISRKQIFDDCSHIWSLLKRLESYMVRFGKRIAIIFSSFRDQSSYLILTIKIIAIISGPALYVNCWLVRPERWTHLIDLVSAYLPICTISLSSFLVCDFEFPTFLEFSKSLNFESIDFWRILFFSLLVPFCTIWDFIGLNITGNVEIVEFSSPFELSELRAWLFIFSNWFLGIVWSSSVSFIVRFCPIIPLEKV